jgi:hypothetical protein
VRPLTGVIGAECALDLNAWNCGKPHPQVEETASSLQEHSPDEV